MTRIKFIAMFFIKPFENLYRKSSMWSTNSFCVPLLGRWRCISFLHDQTINKHVLSCLCAGKTNTDRPLAWQIVLIKAVKDENRPERVWTSMHGCVAILNGINFFLFFLIVISFHNWKYLWAKVLIFIETNVVKM